MSCGLSGRGAAEVEVGVDWGALAGKKRSKADESSAWVGLACLRLHKAPEEPKPQLWWAETPAGLEIRMGLGLTGAGMWELTLAEFDGVAHESSEGRRCMGQSRRGFECWSRWNLSSSSGRDVCLGSRRRCRRLFPVLSGCCAVTERRRTSQGQGQEQEPHQNKCAAGMEYIIAREPRRIESQKTENGQTGLGDLPTPRHRVEAKIKEGFSCLSPEKAGWDRLLHALCTVSYAEETLNSTARSRWAGVGSAGSRTAGGSWVWPSNGQGFTGI